MPGLDEIDREMLRYFAATPGPARTLVARWGRSKLYRHLGALVAQGHLRKEGAIYRLTPCGREIIERPEVTPNAQPEDRLVKAVPHLAMAPTPAHRALLFLVACALVARQHRIKNDHHPGFVIFGPKMRWKSWLLQAACHLAGIPPQEYVIFLVTESGRSLTRRKGHGGALVSARRALQAPVVGLDEFLRAKPEVRKAVELYLFGNIEVADETGTLTVLPVPLVTLNPREGKQTLAERTGLDDAMLRRSICLDVGAVEIPQSLLTEGDILLERMQSLGPLAIPAPAHKDWDPRSEVQATLLMCLREAGLLGGIDVTMLAMLAAGASAWLTKDVALREVLGAYLEITQHLGWLAADWRERLNRALPRQAVAAAPADLDPTATRSVNPYSYTARVSEFLDTCKRLGLSLDQAIAGIRALAELRTEGFDVQVARQLSAAVRAAGYEPGRAWAYLLRQLMAHESLDRAAAAKRSRGAGL